MSEKCIASICRVEELCSFLASCFAYSSTLKMEGVVPLQNSSKFLPVYRDSHSHLQYEYLKSHLTFFFVGSEALTAMVTKGSIFWEITLCSLALSATCLSLVSFLVYSSTLMMDVKCFSENFGWLSTDYTVLYPRGPNSSQLFLFFYS
jgi:hypothetical protein